VWNAREVASVWCWRMTGGRLNQLMIGRGWRTPLDPSPELLSIRFVESEGGVCEMIKTPFEHADLTQLSYPTVIVTNDDEVFTFDPSNRNNQTNGLCPVCDEEVICIPQNMLINLETHAE
jgi:hypothetical protein